jgi:hypothetical protein
LVGRHPITPFDLDSTARNCLLKCDTGYWSNWNTGPAPTTDLHGQICIADNCGSWNTTSIEINECYNCWAKTDLDDYATWPGRGSYTQAAIAGRADPPFTHDLTHNKACQLMCKQDYWSNWKSNAFPAFFPNEQHCTFDNCRTWDPAKTSKACVECWTTADMND